MADSIILLSLNTIKNHQIIKKQVLLFLAAIVFLFAWPANTIITRISAFSVTDQENASNTASSNASSQNGATQANSRGTNSSRLEPVGDTAPNRPYVLPQSQSATQEFFIEIPKIGLRRDIQANVDPTKPEIYFPVMENFVAHGLGTSFPNEKNGNVYLFAHSKQATGSETPDGGWFTQIDQLVPGDQILLHYNGMIYTYTVKTSFVVDPFETGVYTNKSPFPGKNAVTLQTCYPRGDTSARLIVEAEH